jgi:predicted signal transduction protein with EAL and GGDEF domain
VSLTDELRHFLSWIVLGAAILFFAGLGLAWAIGGRISQTLYGLRIPALPLGIGKLVIVPSLRLKEAEETRHALIQATAMLLEAQQKALHDPLTGLPNRELFAEVANQRLTVCGRGGTTLAVLYLDVDSFKLVNDKYGLSVTLCYVLSRRGSGTQSGLPTSPRAWEATSSPFSSPASDWGSPRRSLAGWAICCRSHIRSAR